MWRVYKHTGKDKDSDAYKEAPNAATNEVRKSKRNFEYKFAQNIKSESKSFYAYVRSKQNVRDKVGPPEDNFGNIITQGFLMAEELNMHFSSVFTRQDTSWLPVPETKFKGSDAELRLEGYAMFRKDGMGRRGGGVLLYIKETIPAYEVQLHEEADCYEAIWCKLVTGHTTDTIEVVYRCPSITKENNEKIHNAISEVSKGECIIMGDFKFLTMGILNGIHYRAQG